MLIIVVLTFFLILSCFYIDKFLYCPNQMISPNNLTTWWIIIYTWSMSNEN